jgi:hypothetical protein
MANPTIEIRSNDATSDASVAKVDMKLEVVVIPVSDVDHAKEFYKRLAAAGCHAVQRCPVHAAGLRVLGRERDRPSMFCWLAA